MLLCFQAILQAATLFWFFRCLFKERKSTEESKGEKKTQILLWKMESGRGNLMKITFLNGI